MIKLGLFADSHYSTQERVGNRRPSLSLDKLNIATRAFIEAGVSVVVCLGDLVNGEEDDNQNANNLRNIAKPLHSLRERGVLVYCVSGNHDTEVFTKREFSEISRLVTAPHSVVIDRMRLIFIDASYTSDGKHYVKRDIDWTDSFIGGGQDRWLRSQLQASVKNGESAYIFIHQNLDPNVDKNHIVSNAAEIRQIIEQFSSVRAVFQGHYHKGARNIVGGVEYITIPAMCEGEDNKFEIVELS